MIFFLPLLNKISNKTDKSALNFFKSVNLNISYKKDHSPVSEADQKIEEIIRIEAKKNRLAVFGEEFGEDKHNGLRLIVDPIDGTRNFIRGIPIFATLLAIEKEGEIIAGLVSAPALYTRWYAEKDKGAFIENTISGKKKKIIVSNISKISEAQIFYGSVFGNELNNKTYSEKLINILNKFPRQRGFGDFYQHMLVAQGSGEIALDPVVKPWDIAAIKIIIEEADGKFSSFSGKNSIYEGTAISSNINIYNELLNLLK